MPYERGFFSRIKSFIFGDKEKTRVSLGFYYERFRRVFSTDLERRFSKSENFILSTERNVYDRDRVMKIPHFLDDFDSNVAHETNRGKLQVSINGKPYTLELMKINDDQSVGGRKLYEIKGLKDGLIGTTRKDLAAYCIWVDSDKKISDKRYNIPGNLRQYFNGPVKVFSPVVRDSRDRSVKVFSTLITLPVYLTTLLVKGIVYTAAEVVSNVLPKVITRLILPSLFGITACSFLTLGLVSLPFMGKQMRSKYLEKYVSVFEVAREMFFSGTFGYIKAALLDPNNYQKLKSGEGSSVTPGSELKISKLKRAVIYVIDGFPAIIEGLMIAVRGTTNIACSFVRAVASFTVGVLSFNSEYLKASVSLVKQPFLEIRDDIEELITGKVRSSSFTKEQIIGYDKELFESAVQERDRANFADHKKSISGVSSLGANLRDAGFEEAQGSTTPFTPRSCKPALKSI